MEPNLSDAFARIVEKGTGVRVDPADLEQRMADLEALDSRALQFVADRASVTRFLAKVVLEGRAVPELPSDEAEPQPKPIVPEARRASWWDSAFRAVRGPSAEHGRN